MNRRKEPLLLNCCICGKQFEHWTYSRRFACDNPACHSALIKKQWSERKKKRMRICVICNAEFELTKKKPRKTCGDACERESIHRSLSGIKPTGWDMAYSDSAKLKNRKTRSKNPILGRYDTHCNAKDYSLVSPEGDVYEGHNLIDFVRNHHILFDIINASDDRAIARIACNLNSMRPGLRQRTKISHGWTWLGLN